MVYTFAIIFSIIFMISIILLVRNKKLHEKYSILWIIFSVIIIILAWNHRLLDVISSEIGIYYAPALLFLVACAFLILYTLHLSIVVTKQNKELIRLNQEIGIINKYNKISDE